MFKLRSLYEAARGQPRVKAAECPVLLTISYHLNRESIVCMFIVTRLTLSVVGCGVKAIQGLSQMLSLSHRRASKGMGFLSFCNGVLLGVRFLFSSPCPLYICTWLGMSE